MLPLCTLLASSLLFYIGIPTFYFQGLKVVGCICEILRPTISPHGVEQHVTYKLVRCLGITKLGYSNSFGVRACQLCAASFVASL